MNVVQRMKAPTPKFFRTLRATGLALVAASGALLAAPVALHAVVITRRQSPKEADEDDDPPNYVDTE